jgi:hypothetical protein
MRLADVAMTGEPSGEVLRLATEARRRGLSPEKILKDGIARSYTAPVNSISSQNAEDRGQLRSPFSQHPHSLGSDLSHLLPAEPFSEEQLLDLSAAISSPWTPQPVLSNAAIHSPLYGFGGNGCALWDPHMPHGDLSFQAESSIFHAAQRDPGLSMTAFGQLPGTSAQRLLPTVPVSGTGGIETLVDISWQTHTMTTSNNVPLPQSPVNIDKSRARHVHARWSSLNGASTSSNRNVAVRKPRDPIGQNPEPSDTDEATTAPASLPHPVRRIRKGKKPVLRSQGPQPYQRLAPLPQPVKESKPPDSRSGNRRPRAAYDEGTKLQVAQTRKVGNCIPCRSRRVKVGRRQASTATAHGQSGANRVQQCNPEDDRDPKGICQNCRARPLSHFCMGCCRERVYQVRAFRVTNNLRMEKHHPYCGNDFGDFSKRKIWKDLPPRYLVTGQAHVCGSLLKLELHEFQPPADEPEDQFLDARATNGYKCPYAFTEWKHVAQSLFEFIDDNVWRYVEEYVFKHGEIYTSWPFEQARHLVAEEDEVSPAR